MSSLNTAMANKGPSPAINSIKLHSSKGPSQLASKAALSTAGQSEQSAIQGTSYFTKSQFAVALVIQKSKPEGLSVTDYCQQLRKSIRPGCPIPNGTHRYIDTCEFWKDQYTKIYEEKKALQDKVVLLEELNQTQRHDVLDTNSNADLNENGKRPALLEEVDELLHTQRENPATPDSTMLRLSRYILQMGTQRGKLETTVKESKSPEYLDNLVKTSDQMLGLMEAALDDCIVPLWFLKTPNNIRTVRLLQQVMHQISLSFRSCFTALNELCLTILGRSKRSGIVYRLALFFKKALDHLRTICTLQAEHEDRAERKTQSKRIKAYDEYATSKYLSEALISIALTEWKVGKAGHSEILEGILFSILDHTGRLVSEAVFNEHVAISNQPGNINLGAPETSTRSANTEGRYIIPILYAAIGGTNARKQQLADILSSNSPSGSKDKNHSAGDRHDLFTKARKRLQETLVKRALGGDELESLSLPTLPDDVDSSPISNITVEKYSPEWFLESVWAVLGWELAV